MKGTLVPHAASNSDATICRATDPDELVEAHLGLAYSLAAHFTGRGVSLEDLRQTAAEGLVKAAHGYDPERGVHFAAYAVPTITGMLKRYFRDTTWSVRVPRTLQENSLKITAANQQLSQELQRSPTPSEIARHLGIRREEVIDGIAAAAAYRAVEMPAHESRQPTTGDAIDPDIEKAENVQALRPLIAALPERDRRLLSLRFTEEMTQTEIAERLGISQMQVSRLLIRCLGRLRCGLIEPPRAS